MERDPLFAHSQVELTMDEQRELATARTLRILEYGFLPSGGLMDDPRLVGTSGGFHLLKCARNI